ncbi:unnamed protein product [Tuber aestivum]|uniref:Uncharacterized protein n=1 Tax=Tuber aestivum TaxID=59557 RepID=A0A292PNZ4_9PEZI|nr:unnamed protein product [Tuber aestivum]
MATITITQPLRSLVSRSSVAGISAGVTTVISADAAAAGALSMLGRRQPVPSGARAPVRRRAITAMGLSDGKEGVFFIAGSRHAVGKEGIAGSSTTLSSLRSAVNNLQQRRRYNHPRSLHASSALLVSDRENTPGHNTAATTTTKSAPVKKRRKILPITPHEDIYNIPNFLTFSRLLASPIIGCLVLQEQHAAALALFAAAGLTDLVDGYLARKWNLKTVVGSVIDPMADKTLMTVLTVTLAMKGLLPVWLAGIILGRDIGLAISAIYFRWISLPPPKTMARYWDFSLPSAEVRPTTISKLNTALQLGLIGACMAHPFMVAMVPDWDVALQVMQYTVATTTIWSGLSYVYSKDAVKILKPPQEPEDGANPDDNKKKMT